MKKILNKFFSKKREGDKSLRKKMYSILNDQDFVKNMGKTMDILYEYDKRK